MKFFMIVPKVNQYCWLGRKSDEDGLTLSRVRHESVVETWKPIAVEWLPETQGRPLCDFPVFTSIVRCMSGRAATALRPLFAGGVEFLPLKNVGDYIGFHCINWLEAADLGGVDQERVSIHSTRFVPRLKSEVVSSQHVFGVPQMITKLFVSSAVKQEIEDSGFTGLDFYEVELTSQPA